jgi:tetratricopeptide (TPR) repeat protein
MDTQNYTLFEDYLNGTLTENEKISFESNLKNNTIFNEEFNTYKELSGFLEHKFQYEDASAAFQNNLTTISNKHFEKLKTPKRIIKFKTWQFAIAASLLLFFGIQYFSPSSPSYNDFTSYDTISLVLRDSGNKLLTNAEVAFNAKNFIKAEQYFSQLLETDVNNNELKLYKAFSQIELNQFNEADTTLSILSKGNSVYKNKATWYLALSKLKQKEYAACITVLKTIDAEADDYKKAKKLLKKLE